MEYSESILQIRVSYVIWEFSKLSILWANIKTRRGASRVWFCIEPVTISISSHRMIILEDVVWVSYPKACWWLISVKKTPRGMNSHNKVTLNQILSFSCVFNENCVAHCHEGYILNNSQIVNSVKSDCSIVSVMYWVSSNIAIRYITYHMKVKRISTQLESLPHVLELSVLDSPY